MDLRDVGVEVIALGYPEPEEVARAALEEGVDVVGYRGSTLDYEVGEWIEHGGPSEETATDIRRELEASIDPDRTGLHVRRERGGLKMVYPQRVLPAIRQLSTS